MTSTAFEKFDHLYTQFLKCSGNEIESKSRELIDELAPHKNEPEWGKHIFERLQSTQPTPSKKQLCITLISTLSDEDVPDVDSPLPKLEDQVNAICKFLATKDLSPKEALLTDLQFLLVCDLRADSKEYSDSVKRIQAHLSTLYTERSWIDLLELLDTLAFMDDINPQNKNRALVFFMDAVKIAPDDRPPLGKDLATHLDCKEYIEYHLAMTLAGKPDISQSDTDLILQVIDWHQGPGEITTYSALFYGMLSSLNLSESQKCKKICIENQLMEAGFNVPIDHPEEYLSRFAKNSQLQTDAPEVLKHIFSLIGQNEWINDETASNLLAVLNRTENKLTAEPLHPSLVRHLFQSQRISYVDTPVAAALICTQMSNLTDLTDKELEDSWELSKNLINNSGVAPRSCLNLLSANQLLVTQNPGVATEFCEIAFQWEMNEEEAERLIYIIYYQMQTPYRTITYDDLSHNVQLIQHVMNYFITHPKFTNDYLEVCPKIATIALKTLDGEDPASLSSLLNYIETLEKNNFSQYLKFTQPGLTLIKNALAFLASEANSSTRYPASSKFFCLQAANSEGMSLEAVKSLIEIIEKMPPEDQLQIVQEIKAHPPANQAILKFFETDALLPSHIKTLSLVLCLNAKDSEHIIKTGVDAAQGDLQRMLGKYLPNPDWKQSIQSMIKNIQALPVTTIIAMCRTNSQSAIAAKLLNLLSRPPRHAVMEKILRILHSQNAYLIDGMMKLMSTSLGDELLNRIAFQQGATIEINLQGEILNQLISTTLTTEQVQKLRAFLNHLLTINGQPINPDLNRPIQDLLASLPQEHLKLLFEIFHLETPKLNAVFNVIHLISNPREINKIVQYAGEVSLDVLIGTTTLIQECPSVLPYVLDLIAPPVSAESTKKLLDLQELNGSTPHILRNIAHFAGNDAEALWKCLEINQIGPGLINEVILAHRKGVLKSPLEFLLSSSRFVMSATTGTDGIARAETLTQVLKKFPQLISLLSSADQLNWVDEAVKLTPEQINALLRLFPIAEHYPTAWEKLLKDPSLQTFMEEAQKYAQAASKSQRKVFTHAAALIENAQESIAREIFQLFPDPSDKLAAKLLEMAVNGDLNTTKELIAKYKANSSDPIILKCLSLAGSKNRQTIDDLLSIQPKDHPELISSISERPYSPRLSPKQSLWIALAAKSQEPHSKALLPLLIKPAAKLERIENNALEAAQKGYVNLAYAFLTKTGAKWEMVKNAPVSLLVKQQLLDLAVAAENELEGEILMNFCLQVINETAGEEEIRNRLGQLQALPKKDLNDFSGLKRPDYCTQINKKVGVRKSGSISIQQNFYDANSFAKAVATCLITQNGRINGSMICQAKDTEFFKANRKTSLGKYLERVLNAFENNPEFSEKLSLIKAPSSPPAEKLIRDMLDIISDAPLTDRHAQIAVLSALLTDPRQSEGVGSCFATSILSERHSNDEKLLQVMDDYASLIGHNRISRKNSTGNLTHYPITIPQKTNENKLVKSLEATIGSMGYTGIIARSHLANVTSDAGSFGVKLSSILPKYQTHPSPLDQNAIIQSLASSFKALAEEIYDPELPDHTKTSFGGWRLSNKNTGKLIKDAQQYREFMVKVIHHAEKNLLKKHPASQEFVKSVMNHLALWVGQHDTAGGDFIANTFEAYKNNPQSNETITPWSAKGGGYTRAVFNSFHGNGHNFAQRSPISSEIALQAFLHQIDQLPKSEKKACLKNQTPMYHTMSYTGHAFSLRPIDVLKRLSKGEQPQDITRRLIQEGTQLANRPLSLPEARLILDQFITKLDQSHRIPFKNIAEKNILPNQGLSLSKFCQKLLEQAAKMEGGQKGYASLLQKLESVVMNLPELKEDIPAFIQIGDLNWVGPNHDHILLSYNVSPITGKITAYRLRENGTEVKLYKVIDSLTFYGPFKK